MSVSAQEALREMRMAIKKWLLETSEQRTMILERKGAITKILPCGVLESGMGKTSFEQFIQKLGGTLQIRRNQDNKFCFDIRFTDVAVNRYKGMQSQANSNNNNSNNSQDGSSGSPRKPAAAVSAAGHTVADVNNWRAQMEKDMLPQAESMELLKKLVEFPMDLATLQGTKIG